MAAHPVSADFMIVYSVKGTSKTLMNMVAEAVGSYSETNNSRSIVSNPIVFEIPSGSSSGRSLGSDLTKRLTESVGAIVFVDDLRPNVAYELGFFHGRGRHVLLMSSKLPSEIWTAISDLAGCPLYILSDDGDALRCAVHAYIADTIRHLGKVEEFQCPVLPEPPDNMIPDLCAVAQVPPDLGVGEYGPLINVKTWGGIVFDLNKRIHGDGHFRILVRSAQPDARYSIYFRVRYLDSNRNSLQVFLGLTSLRSHAVYERNERNLPSSPLGTKWMLLTGTLRELMRKSEVADVCSLQCLEVVRVRAGDYRSDPFEEVPAYQIGFVHFDGIS